MTATLTHIALARWARRMKVLSGPSGSILSRTDAYSAAALRSFAITSICSSVGFRYSNVDSWRAISPQGLEQRKPRSGEPAGCELVRKAYRLGFMRAGLDTGSTLPILSRAYPPDQGVGFSDGQHTASHLFSVGLKPPDGRAVGV